MDKKLTSLRFKCGDTHDCDDIDDVREKERTDGSAGLKFNNSFGNTAGNMKPWLARAINWQHWKKFTIKNFINYKTAKKTYNNKFF